MTSNDTDEVYEESLTILHVTQKKRKCFPIFPTTKNQKTYILVQIVATFLLKSYTIESPKW